MHVKIPELKIIMLGIPLSLAWEILQSPFYMDTFEEPWTTVLYNRIHCTLGDVMILLGAFWLVAMIWGRPWLGRAGMKPAALFVVVGVVYTICSERYNVSLARNWAYSEWMPMIRSIGLVPIIQWLVVPSLVIRLARQLESSNWHRRGITIGPRRR